MEKTLIIAKPDAIQRGLVGEIMSRLENKGLKLIGLKMMNVDSALLKAHYAHISDKPFYQDVEDFMRSSPVVVMAWEGFECTEAVRILVGPTNSRQAPAGSIRGDFGMAVGRNLIHASDSSENGKTEVERFFEKSELFEYDKTEWAHVYEAHELQ
jgi:nucleoside-diphosphate kinase